jgi:hypothetical protein
MANVKVSWVLPTTRESGKPLAVNDIDVVTLEQSADGGANFVVIDVLPPTILETTVTDLEPGEWFFRGTVRDRAGRTSKPVVGSISIADNTAPGELTLTLELV